MREINTYRHYFTITALNFSKLIFELHNFNKNLVTYNMVLERRGRGVPPKVTTKIDKTLYIIETENPENPLSKNIIRYPISLLESIINYFSNGTTDDMVIKNHDYHGSAKAIFNLAKHLKARDYQGKYIDIITTTKEPNTLIDLYTGYGKALNVNTPIRYPNKWKTMGDVKVNDIVIDKDGKETTVTGVYPQGKLDLYRVRFQDDREVEVCLEHLWKVYYGSTENESQVVNTSFISYLLRSRKTEVYIDLIEPEEIEDVDLLISPYVLGMVISNYSLARNDVDISKELLKLDLLKDNVRDLFIPDIYKKSSIEQRYALLRGLVKTNTKMVFNHVIEHITYSPQLSKDIQEIVRSLGGICYHDKNRYGNRLEIELKDISKICDAKPIIEIDNSNLRLKIKSITKVEKAEAVCISVDNDEKLFVVKDYIVTHNTFIANSSLSIMKKKFAVVILPRYIDKWIGDITYLTDITKDEILVIQGLEMLMSVITADKKELKKYKCFILSLTTVSLFIKSFMLGDKVASAGLSPEMIFKNLEVDTVLNDETHQEFFSVYRLMLYCNHRLTLGLSATLFNKDKNVDRLYRLGFPHKNRISNIVPYSRYIYVYSIRFLFRNRKNIRYKNNFGYNQAAFEKSLMKNSTTLKNYLDMVKTTLENIYLRRREDKQKALIFMGTVAMCSKTVNYFKYLYPKLKITMYTEKEDYTVIADADLIVTTYQSAGTALDISDLVSVVQTINMDSMQANTQMIGRLREKKGVKMIFAYLWSSDIPPHKKYNGNRLQLFRKIAKHIDMKEYRHMI